MSIIQAAGSGEVGSSGNFYSYTIDQSLRFNDNDSAYLSRTPSSAGNRRTFTLSCWIKRANLGITTSIFGAAGNYYNFRFNSTDTMTFYGNGSDLNFQTTRLFRDNGWYHLVVGIDTTQSSTLERVKIYINGTQETEFISSTSGLNSQLAFNNTVAHAIGRRESTSNLYADLYLAEMHWIDGTALTPSSFGETKDGIWIPKEYSGSYGTNGFYLTFEGTGTAATSQGTTAQTNIGDDQSGTGNNFAVSSLVASDVVPDSPTNNFATWNPLIGVTSTVYSEGNLENTSAANDWEVQLATMFPAGIAGEWYAEFYVHTCNGSGTRVGVGVTDTLVNAEYYLGQASPDVAYYDINDIYTGGSKTADSNLTFAAGDIISVVLNLDEGEVTFRKNNSTMTNGTQDLIASTLYTFATTNYGGGGVVANFGQDSSFAGNKTSGSAGASDGNGKGDFYYAPPSGLALCSSNLSEPAITDGSEHFTPYIYTANNASTRSFTGLGFAPNFLWFKARSQAFSHRLFNSVVGVGTHAYADRTDRAAWDSLTSFDADGFSVETDATAGNLLNYLTSTYVAWAWKAGTAASGSEVGNNPAFSSSSNAVAGFSIVSYTGTGAVGTVSHGCGAKPTMIMIKNRSADENWAVYHAGTASDPETDYMILNLVNAVADSANWWNDTAPTDSVFTVGTDHTVNADGEDYIAYCFADVEGYMRASHYIGRHTQTAFVHTGFRPAFLMLKKTTASATYGWQIYDTSRSPVNVSLLPGMWADTNAAETNNQYYVNIHSNGFRLTGAGANQNANGVRYVYFAIADQPAKFSNAR